MLILRVLSFIVFISTAAFAAPENVIWTAIQTGREVVTSQEIKRYIENVLISDGMQRSLFREVGENLEAYNDHIQKITQEAFPMALKRIALLRFIQDSAIKNTDRALFSTTSEEFNRLVRERVNLQLRIYSERANFNELALTYLVQDLKKSGFPHSPKEVDSTIYKRWLNRLKFQLKEEIRERDAFNYICSIGHCGQESITQILKKKKRTFQRSLIKIIPSSDNSETYIGDEAINYITETSFKLLATKSAEATPEKRYAFIGRVIDQKAEFMAVNDWDITSVLERLGYPDTDDFGRTSGLMLNYRVNGTKGSLTVELINWLFSEELEKINDVKRQHVEEEATLRVTSRQFLDSKGNKWIILGVAANHRIQKENVHSWIQGAFHTLNPSSSQRENVARDGREIFLEGLIGAGGQYSIIDRPHVDIKITGEGILVPTLGTIDRSRIMLSSSLDANFYLRHKDYPLFFTSIFANYSFLTNGEIESMVGAKAGLGILHRNIYWQASLFVIRWDSAIDRRYEGAASWTTGLALSATFVSKQPKPEYIFN